MKHDSSARCPRCEAIIATCHPDLQAWFWRAKEQFPDLHTSCGYRGEQEQLDAYHRGASRVKWPNSKHNKAPAMAMDLFQIGPDHVARWERRYLKAVADWLKGQGCPLTWGGDWRKFADMPHWEIPSGD